jgi:hypothetical protein
MFVRRLFVLIVENNSVSKLRREEENCNFVIWMSSGRCHLSLSPLSNDRARYHMHPPIPTWVRESL